MRYMSRYSQHHKNKQTNKQQVNITFSNTLAIVHEKKYKVFKTCIDFALVQNFQLDLNTQLLHNKQIYDYIFFLFIY